jgi:protein-disulfide isomerase
MEKSIKIKIPNPWVISTIILLILIIALFFTGKISITGKFALTKEQVGEKAINYINKRWPSASAKLISVEDEGEIYKVLTSSQGQQIPVYVTKDGKYLILPGGIIDMTQEIQTEEQREEQQEVPKSDKPEVHVFVMSFCPYGLQFLKAYVQVMELLKNKADLQVNFVDYIMHGERELHGNNFLYCVQKVEKEKFTKYLRCFVESGDYEKCLDSAEVDKIKVENCISTIDKQFNLTNLFNDQSTWLNGRFPKYPVEEDLNSKYNVQGSPTFVVNGKVISVQRSAEAVKQAICSAFNSPPEECNQKLNENPEAPGIGKIAAGGSTSSGSCG